MIYFLLFVSLLAAVARNSVSKAAGIKFSGLSALINLNILLCAMALPTFLIFGIDTAHFSDKNFIFLSALFALFTLIGSVFQIIAIKYAPLPIVSLVYCSGFVISTFYSAIAFDEKISPLRAVLIILLLFSLAFIFIKRGNPKGSIKPIFLLFAIPAMLSSGFLGVTQKIFTMNYGNESNNSFLFCGFGLIFFAMLILRAAYKPQEIAKFKSTKFIIPAIVFSIALITTNKLNLYLIELLPGTVFFPFMNAGAIALNAIISAIIFKEKLSKTQYASCALAIIVICIIPFV